MLVKQLAVMLANREEMDKVKFHGAKV